MAVKTAISLNESLFEKVETLTQELNISRSRLFAIAVQEFIERHETRRMIAAINKVQDEYTDDEDRAIFQVTLEKDGVTIRRKSLNIIG